MAKLYGEIGIGYPQWYADGGKTRLKEGGDLMRFYTNQHPFYCGIDLHARSMYVGILSQDGEIVLHRNMKAAPEAFLKAVASPLDPAFGAGYVPSCQPHALS
jgi:hypothetical protein